MRDVKAPPFSELSILEILSLLPLAFMGCLMLGCLKPLQPEKLIIGHLLYAGHYFRLNMLMAPNKGDTLPSWKVNLLRTRGSQT